MDYSVRDLIRNTDTNQVIIIHRVYESISKEKARTISHELSLVQSHEFFNFIIKSSEFRSYMQEYGDELPPFRELLGPARFMVALNPDKLLNILGSYTQTESIARYLCNLLDEWNDKNFRNIIILDFGIREETPQEDSFFYPPSEEIIDEEGEDAAACDAYIRGLVCELVKSDILYASLPEERQKVILSKIEQILSSKEIVYERSDPDTLLIMDLLEKSFISLRNIVNMPQ